jgi:hypothetical protein
MEKKKIRLTESELINLIKNAVNETNVPRKKILSEGAYDSAKAIYDSCSKEKRPATINRTEVQKIAENMSDALDDWTPNRDTLQKAITSCQTMVNFCAVSKLYKTLYGEDLLEGMDDTVNLDGNWRKFVYIPLYNIQQNQIEQDAATKPAAQPAATQTTNTWDTIVAGPLGCAKNEKGYQLRGGTGNSQWFSFPYGKGEIRGFLSGGQMIGSKKGSNLQYLLNGQVTKQTVASCLDGDGGEMSVGQWVDA